MRGAADPLYRSYGRGGNLQEVMLGYSTQQGWRLPTANWALHRAQRR
jgi:phosphoenolpyruvate carboxylase